MKLDGYKFASETDRKTVEDLAVAMRQPADGCKIVIITGPTASGKSLLAGELLQGFGDPDSLGSVSPVDFKHPRTLAKVIRRGWLLLDDLGEREIGCVSDLLVSIAATKTCIVLGGNGGSVEVPTKLWVVLTLAAGVVPERDLQEVSTLVLLSGPYVPPADSKPNAGMLSVGDWMEKHGHLSAPDSVVTLGETGKGVHIMLDLETLGNGPRSVIRQIGAVKFSKAKGVFDRFSIAVDGQSCIAAGLEMDVSTVEWWLQQGEKARSVMCATGIPLSAALGLFQKWFFGGGGTVDTVWGRGPSFDCAILASAYRAVEVEIPWRHWQERCVRTLEEEWPLVVRIKPPKDKAHIAVEDAEAQASHVLACWAARDRVVDVLRQR